MAKILSFTICLAAGFVVALAIICLEDGFGEIFNRLALLLAMTVGGGI